MKRALLLAISALALTAASQQIQAAESETPAMREIAPVTERAPAPQRAVQRAPARQAPARQAPQSSPQSSFTGSQAGGFGGGNAGGGSFADPPCQSTQGLNQSGCVATGLNFSLNHTGGTGGGVYQYMVPVGPYFVAGVLADIAASNSTASSAYSTTHPDAFPGSATAENFSGSVRQGTNGSLRLKAGVPFNSAFGATLLYFTAGAVVSKIDIDYSYSASSVITGGGCSFFNPACATNSFSSFHSSKTRTGFAGGAGLDVKVPGFGPGVVLTFDYTINAFGSYSETATINTTSVLGLSCVSTPSRPCSVADNLSIKGQVYHKPTIGLRIGL